VFKAYSKNEKKTEDPINSPEAVAAFSLNQIQPPLFPDKVVDNGKVSKSHFFGVKLSPNEDDLKDIENSDEFFSEDYESREVITQYPRYRSSLQFRDSSLEESTSARNYTLRDSDEDPRECPLTCNHGLCAEELTTVGIQSRAFRCLCYMGYTGSSCDIGELLKKAFYHSQGTHTQSSCFLVKMDKL